MDHVFPFLLCKYLEVVLLIHIVDVYLTLLRTLTQFYIVDIIILLFQQKIMRVLVAHFLYHLVFYQICFDI